MQPDSDTGGVLLDLVAATDYLSTTHRLGLTTWEAFEEAIRWWVTDRVTLPGDVPDADVASLPWGDDPDPLRRGSERLFAPAGSSGGPEALELGSILTAAL